MSDSQPTNQPAPRKRWNLPPDMLASVRARVRTAVSNSDDFKTRRDGCEALREIDAVMQPQPASVPDAPATVTVNVVVAVTEPPADQPAIRTDSPWPIPPDILAKALDQLRRTAESHPSKKKRSEAAKLLREHAAAKAGKDPQ